MKLPSFFKSKDFWKKAALIALILALVTTNAITLKLYLELKYQGDQRSEETIYSEVGDEISRIKYFVKDWFDELSEDYPDPKVYVNEIRFSGGEYTITAANNRIRAVYPRGERYFQMDQITYVEFYQDGDAIYCRLHYSEAGEYRFTIQT